MVNQDAVTIGEIRLMSAIKESLKGRSLSKIKKAYYNALLNGNSISLYNQRTLVSKFLRKDFDFVLEMLAMLGRYRQLSGKVVNHTISLIPAKDVSARLHELKQLNLNIDNYNAALKRLSGISRAHCVELFDSLAASQSVNSKSYKYVVKSILNQPLNTSLDYVIIKRLYPHIYSFDEVLVRQLLEVFLMVEDNSNLRELYERHKLLLDNTSAFKLVNHFIRVDITLAQAILNDWLRFNQMTPSLQLLELKLSGLADSRQS